MGIRSKFLGVNAKVVPGSMTINSNCDWDSDGDSTSAGWKTPRSDSTRSSSFVSTRPNSRGSSARPTPRSLTQRRRPVVDLSKDCSPTSSDSRRSAWDAPTSPWTHAAPFERKKTRGNDLSHLIGPVQPWNEYIEGYAKNLVEKVGGTQQAWTDVMSLNNGAVRQALFLNGMTSRNSRKPHPLPQEVSTVLQALLESLPPAYRNDTAKLTFALHERPFFCSALEKHVELVLWGIVSARNDWM